MSLNSNGDTQGLDHGILEYQKRVQSRVKRHPEYRWLQYYLQRKPNFLEERINPVAPGCTRLIVADFYSDSERPPSISCPLSPKNIEKTLFVRSAAAVVRLIFVVSISGIDEEDLHKQVSGGFSGSRNGIKHDKLAPVLTISRTAGDKTTRQHPIKRHGSYLIDPNVLCQVGAATRMDPEIFFRHLDQRRHLVYRPSNLPMRSSEDPDEDSDGFIEDSGRIWQSFSLGADQQNYLTATMIAEKTAEGESDRATLVLLANEDNCLGIDFNKYASSLDQLSRSSNWGGPLHRAFEAVLRSKDTQGREEILSNPLVLVWDYASGLCNSLACQVDLYYRRWDCLYEQYANTSAVWGDRQSRTEVRQEVKQLSNHVKYLRQSVADIKGVIPIAHNAGNLNSHMQEPEGLEVRLNKTYADFREICRLLESLKTSYDIFLEKQVEKISLKETRESMAKARDLQRLSYLGFVFAPLSLASSFFSINIQPLGGQASLWSFIVTSISILCLSLLVLFSLTDRVHELASKASEIIQQLVRSIHSRPLQETSLPFSQTPGKPSSFPGHTIENEEFQYNSLGNTTGQISTLHPSNMSYSQTAPNNFTSQSARVPPNDVSRSMARKAKRNHEYDVTTILPPQRHKRYFDRPARQTAHDLVGVSADVHDFGSRWQFLSSPVLEDQHARPTHLDTIDDNVSSGYISIDNSSSEPPSNSSARAMHSQAPISPPFIREKTPSIPTADIPENSKGNSNINPETSLILRSPRVDRELAKENNWDQNKLAASLLYRTWSNVLPDTENHRTLSSETKMVLDLTKLCEERNVSEIERIVTQKDNLSPDLKFDIVCADIFTKAAKNLLWDALPILYHAITEPRVQVACLKKGLYAVVEKKKAYPEVLRWLCEKASLLNIWTKDTFFSKSLMDTAIFAENLEAGRMLLGCGVDPNWRPEGHESGSVLLRLAADNGSLGFTNLLLDAGADPSDPEVMLVAAENGHLEVIKALHAKGAPISTPCRSLNDDPFCQAAGRGHWDVMAFMLDLSIPLDEVISPQYNRGEAALISTASSTKGSSGVGICLELLNRGVKMNFLDHDQLSASIVYVYAVLVDELELLQRISEAGTDPNAIGNHTSLMDPQWMESSRGGLSVEDSGSISMLALACGAGRLEAAALLLQHGANVNYGGKANGRAKRLTPLHLAAKYGHLEIVRLLLSHGANINTCATDDGVLPIHSAAGAGRVDCAHQLLKCGAAMESFDKIGQTPLILAARSGERDMVEWLLSQGASISATDADLWTAAHRAAWNEHGSTLDILGQRGADFDAETAEGFTVRSLSLSHQKRGDIYE